MLPSPGFSIPSIGTPLHQPEEDQLIQPNVFQQQVQQVPPLAPMGGPVSLGGGGMTPGSLGLAMGMPLLTPQKPMHTYVPGYSTPQMLMQPQTPVSTVRSTPWATSQRSHSYSKT